MVNKHKEPLKWRKHWNVTEGQTDSWTDGIPLASTVSALRSMRTRCAVKTRLCIVLARGILSVLPSHSGVFFQMNEDTTIVRFSAPGTTIILVSEEVKFIRIFLVRALK